MALFKEVNAKVIVLPKSDLNYKLKIVLIFLTPSRYILLVESGPIDMTE